MLVPVTSGYDFQASHADFFQTFYGKGKKSAWEAWKSYPEVTQAFLYMVRHPHAPLTVEAQHFQILERFSVILYDKTSSQESVNEARRELFCQKKNNGNHSTIDNRALLSMIPPTQDALLQHTKRVAYQAGIWTTSNLSLQQ